jgi:hypothetical protein
MVGDLGFEATAIGFGDPVAKDGRELVRLSASCWRRSGAEHWVKALAALRNQMPSWWSWRASHSCWLMQILALNGKYGQMNSHAKWTIFEVLRAGSPTWPPSRLREETPRQRRSCATKV